MKFPCSQCGACCKNIAWLKNAAQIAYENGGRQWTVMQLKDFPHDTKPDGSCSQLGEDNLCKVYDNRPDVCSVDKVWLHVFKPVGMTKRACYNMNTKLCKEMAGVD